MPSGSHAGGGGGGGHSGGSFSGGGSTGGPRGPRWGFGRGFYGPGVIIINNRPYRMGKGAGIGYFLSLFAVFIAIFVLFGGVTMFVGGNSEKNLREEQHEYYQVMITQAKRNPEQRIVMAQVDGIMRHEASGKYQVLYHYGAITDGYTYYIYTLQQASAIRDEGLIEIALETDKATINLNTDSVNTDYLDYPLSADGEYAEALQQKNIGLGMLIGGGAGIAVFVVLAVVLFKKCAKPYEANDNNGGNGGNGNNGGSTSYEDEVTYCQYCGARLKKGDSKCPECGARVAPRL